jgi:phenylacetic acid degradation operon negative regulatory protein
METTSFQSIADLLTADQTPRVWSLLVTVFGELAQDKGARISGPLLSQISTRIGIKPEAMRVALHRLRKDGWIDSARIGRNSAYFLTDWGREQSAQASPRIYGTEPAAKRAWLVLFNPGQTPTGHDVIGTWVSSTVLISPKAPLTNETFMTPLDAETPLPGWMKNKLCDDAKIEMSQQFSHTLHALQNQLGASANFGILDVTALRVLLVHSWRRIILKAPELPDYVFPENWCGAICRDRVSALLDQFPKRGLADLEAATAQHNNA